MGSTWSEVFGDGWRVLISADAPMAVVHREGSEARVVSWPDLDIGPISPSVLLLGATTGAWAFYHPAESDTDELPAGQSAAVHVAPDATVTRFRGLMGEQHPIGASRDGLWLTSAQLPDPRDDAAWRADTHMLVLDPHGMRRDIIVDRRVGFVSEEHTTRHLLVYSGAPHTVREHRGESYDYRFRVLELPEGDLPDVLRVDDLSVASLDETEFLTRVQDVAPRPASPTPEIARVDWARIDLAQAQIDDAVGVVLREFENLASYWHAPDGTTSPLSRGLGSPQVIARGEWPDTVVEVTFTHARYPDRRLRRTIRVFDDAGRIAPAPYAAIHLMEDLDTGQISRLDAGD